MTTTTTYYPDITGRFYVASSVMNNNGNPTISLPLQTHQPPSDDYNQKEATPRGPNGPRIACNFEDSRNFVVICRVDSTTPMENIIWWVLSALGECNHAAAFDTYNRTASAWRVRFVRHSAIEVHALVTLSWEGRRYMDTDALTFVRETPRRPPLMNASEIQWLLQQHTGIPLFLRSVGISGVRSFIMDDLCDDEAGDVYRMGKDWAWKMDNHDKNVMHTPPPPPTYSYTAMAT